MADLEEKFKKLQQYVRSILPELQKVPKLEEEIEQLKMTHSQELQRLVLETQENQDKERDILKAKIEKYEAAIKNKNAEMDALKAEKDDMRKERDALKAEKVKIRKMKETPVIGNVSRTRVEKRD